MRRTLHAVTILLLVIAGGSLSVHAQEVDVSRQLDELRAEVRALRSEVDALRQERTPATPAAVPAPPTQAPVTAEEVAHATTLWGYGELNYNRPLHDAAGAQADLRRGVLGFGHSFSDSTRVLGELEWEHAVVSADDRGESEVEQLYVEHQFRPQFGGRFGLILIPLGLLNEHHEPANYYGVERNLVETAIIPSTWREGGVSLYGSTAAGLSWSTGISTGFDLTRWDATSGEGRESPLGSIHQELQLAKAHDPSLFAAVNWLGMPGMTIGGGAFTGKVGQGQPDFAAANARLAIGEAHARWQSGPFDVSGLYARGSISGTEALNLQFIGSPTPVPKSFWGGYVQAAWRAWQRGDVSLSPFVRFEALNTAASYALAGGLGITAGPTERVWTAGINYLIAQGVIFKADYQKFRVERVRDRFDLGMGYQF
jgi:outer membrane murein-binding lipoprotein Lpp